VYKYNIITIIFCVALESKGALSTCLQSAVQKVKMTTAVNKRVL